METVVFCQSEWTRNEGVWLFPIQVIQNSHFIQNDQNKVTFSSRLDVSVVTRCNISFCKAQLHGCCLIADICEVPAEFFHSVQDLHVLPYGYQVLYLVFLSTYRTGWLLFRDLILFLSSSAWNSTVFVTLWWASVEAVDGSQIPTFLPTEGKCINYFLTARDDTIKMRVLKKYQP